MTTEILPSWPTSEDGERPDPEVVERPKRRSFTAEYRMQILREADACTEHGQLGALLRREGLYASHIAHWRKQRDRGALAGLSAKHGRKLKRSPEEVENAKLRRENEKLKKDLAAAQLVIKVQKNVSALLGIALESAEPTSEQ